MTKLKCPYCGEEAVLKKASFIYHSDKYSGYVYVCRNYPKCDAYVGCHPNTTQPLGRLANKNLRLLKSKAHNVFDVIWKSGAMTRREAYKWLAHKMHIDLEQCHIGMFDENQCNAVIHICKTLSNPKIDKYRARNSKTVFSRGYSRK